MALIFAVLVLQMETLGRSCCVTNMRECRGKQHHAWDTVGIQQTLYLTGKPELSALKWIILLGP